MKNWQIAAVLTFLIMGTVIMSGCISPGSTSRTPAATPTPTVTPTQTRTFTPTPTPSPTPVLKTVLHSTTSVQNDCRPPRLKSGFKEFDQFVKQDSSSCMGTGAPVFPVPHYPAGPIIHDSVVGKFYWWSKLGYCEFRDDGVWILYAWDDQPHYYPGTWEKLGNTSYTSGQIYSYGVKINRPSGAANPAYYNESITFNFDPEEDRLYLVGYDGTGYPTTDAWIARMRR